MVSSNDGRYQVWFQDENVGWLEDSFTGNPNDHLGGHYYTGYLQADDPDHSDTKTWVGQYWMFDDGVHDLSTYSKHWPNEGTEKQ